MHILRIRRTPYQHHKGGLLGARRRFNARFTETRAKADEKAAVSGAMRLAALLQRFRCGVICTTQPSILEAESVLIRVDVVTLEIPRCCGGCERCVE